MVAIFTQNELKKGVLEKVSKLNKFSSFDVKKQESACLGDYHGGSVNSGDFQMLSLSILTLIHLILVKY